MNRSNEIVFINPALVIQKNDFFGSGIPYLPHILAYTVGLVKQQGYKCLVIDGFGLNPLKITKYGDFYRQGLLADDIVKLLKNNTKIIFIYSSAITNVEYVLELVKKIKTKYPKVKIVLLGNTQAVTSFDVTVLAKSFLDCGVDIIIYNSIEKTTLRLLKNMRTVKHNIIFREGRSLIKRRFSREIGEIKRLVLPAWEEFPLENYWKLGYTHGPMQNRFLPLLTSYGCPFKCKFCVNSGINKSRWQAKPAKLVYQEISYLIKKFNIREFHIEDLDPTIDKNRIVALCNLLIKNRLKINWKIVSGTKIETIDKKTLSIMKRSGCSYISFSPETGSSKVLKLMGKSFNYKHCDNIIAECHRLGIKTQACFVIGFPGENAKDRLTTEKYVKKITKLGVDEIAIFIITPLPGSQIFNDLSGYKNFSDLSFSPKWRSDYDELERFRTTLYLKFISWKTRYFPFKIAKNAINSISKNFETKMEMILYRMIKFNFLLTRSRV